MELDQKLSESAKDCFRDSINDKLKFKIINVKKLQAGDASSSTETGKASAR